MDLERQELATLVAAVRAHVAFAKDMGIPGIPEVEAPAEGVRALPERVTDGPAQAPQDPSGALDDAPSGGPATVPTPAAAAAAEVLGDGEDPRLRLKQLAQEAVDCTDCVLHERRNRSVFARGNPAAELVFVGEGPGRDEDRQGLPFVGAAGQLLDKMIGAMGFSQDEVYICNVVKCRPPENRTPRPEEARACARFLRPQLQLVRPQIIVALGRCAAEHLGVAPAQGSWRGRVGSYDGVPVMPTYHPAFLLRSPEFKRVVWQDLQVVMGRMGRTAPARGGG